MKVLVVGANGQLGSEFKALEGLNLDWCFESAETLDISKSQSFQNYFSDKNFDLLINCAAFTNVDKAECDPEIAYAVNQDGVRNIVSVCEMYNIKLIHFSTDYVFSGNNKVPYKENDVRFPVGVYGKSKLNGENIILSSRLDSIIIRTSWVYSIYGNNFVKKILTLAKDHDEISVVSDQIGSPTYARDLAKVTLRIIKTSDYEWSTGDVFHFSNEGFCSWYDFAVSILRNSNLKTKVIKISSDEFISKVKRPPYSLLDKTKIKNTFHIAIDDWNDALIKMLKAYSML